jgi:hypothetical protein
MSIRTTVTLDDDVVDRIKRESQSRGASFRDSLNDLLRAALLVVPLQPGPRHAEILERLVSEHGATGPLVSDAVLAALAIPIPTELGAADSSSPRPNALESFRFPLGPCRNGPRYIPSPDRPDPSLFDPT